MLPGRGLNPHFCHSAEAAYCPQSKNNKEWQRKHSLYRLSYPAG